MKHSLLRFLMCIFTATSGENIIAFRSFWMRLHREEFTERKDRFPRRCTKYYFSPRRSRIKVKLRILPEALQANISSQIDVGLKFAPFRFNARAELPSLSLFYCRSLEVVREWSSNSVDRSDEPDRPCSNTSESSLHHHHHRRRHLRRPTLCYPSQHSKEFKRAPPTLLVLMKRHE